MRIRKQDANGDMTFGQGSDDYYLNTKEGVGQLILTRLRLWYGEWFADPTDGVPYAQDVLGRSSPAVYNGVIKDRILNTTGVLEILSYSSTLDKVTRKLSISAEVATVYGTIATQTIM